MNGYTQSPPVTPPSVSPRSSISGEDSGVPPSSPDCDSVSIIKCMKLQPMTLAHTHSHTHTSQSSSSPSSHTYLPSHLLHSTIPSSTVPHMLMCVLLVAVFFVNPLYFTGHNPNIIGGHTLGGMRTLSSVDSSMVESSEGFMVGVFSWALVWLARLVVAAVCFGWIHIRSVASFDGTSPEGVKFWRFWKQAQQDLHKVDGRYIYMYNYTQLRISAYMCMCVCVYYRENTVHAETVWSRHWQY